MRQAALCLALAYGPAFPQDAVENWFPTHAGDKWIYEHETRDDAGEGRGHLETHRWKTEETIVGSWIISEGALVGSQVRVTDGSPPTGWRVNASPAYLIRGDCLYSDGVGWEPLNHKLTAAYREDLLAGHISPDFCFPFVVHRTWGAPHGLPDWGVNRPEEAKDWEVAAIKARDPSSPDKKKTFHITNISSYPGAGMTVDIWFEKGAGIVREEEIHHGTIGEVRTRLLHFEPATSAPKPTP